MNVVVHPYGNPPWYLETKFIGRHDGSLAYLHDMAVLPLQGRDHGTCVIHALLLSRCSLARTRSMCVDVRSLFEDIELLLGGGPLILAVIGAGAGDR